LQSNLVGPSGTEAMDQKGNAFSSREPVSASLENALAVKLQPVDDLVDHLALGAHRKPNQVELGADHRPRRLAVGGGPMPRLLRILRPATI
jgi:hypothetical protein